MGLAKVILVVSISAGGVLSCICVGMYMYVQREKPFDLTWNIYDMIMHISIMYVYTVCIYVCVMYIVCICACR